MGENAESARTVTNQSHSILVSAEEMNVLLHPNKRQSLIPQPQITLQNVVIHAEKSQRTQSVVDPDEHDVLFH